MFAVCGILFNHESPLRGLEFVTRKISDGAARIKLGIADSISLGNLDSKRDWGYAPEYVEAMWLMLQQDEPDDYVIATEEAHSVREFVDATFSTLGLAIKGHVQTDSNLLRPIDVNYLVGDPSKARKKLGWQHKIAFDDLAELMVLQDLERWERHLRGEVFAWDAPNSVDIQFGSGQKPRSNA
jgi:GDPmannose 4,6-dehydratase